VLLGRFGAEPAEDDALPDVDRPIGGEDPLLERWWDLAAFPVFLDVVDEFASVLVTLAVVELELRLAVEEPAVLDLASAAATISMNSESSNSPRLSP
jgi:hypothetical protein